MHNPPKGKAGSSKYPKTCFALSGQSRVPDSFYDNHNQHTKAGYKPALLEEKRETKPSLHRLLSSILPIAHCLRLGDNRNRFIWIIRHRYDIHRFRLDCFISNQ